MLLLTRRPLSTRNWQIITLRFWDTWSTHLIGSFGLLPLS
jgi:hypothetical protein